VLGVLNDQGQGLLSECTIRGREDRALVSSCIIRWDLYKKEEMAGFEEDLDGHLGLTLYKHCENNTAIKVMHINGFLITASKVEENWLYHSYISHRVLVPSLGAT
jgi:hypothetical protein